MDREGLQSYWRRTRRPRASLRSFRCPLYLEIMDSNVLHVSANSARECQCGGQDVLDGQASAETERVAEGDGQVEESEGRGYAKDVKKRLEEDDRTRSMREGDETGKPELGLGRDERAKEGSSMVEDGIVRFMIEGKWRQVPHEHWTWIPSACHTTYQRCQWFVCDSPFDCSERYHAKVFRDHDYVDWIPKVQLRFELNWSCAPTDHLQLKDSPKSMTPQSLRSHSDVTLLAAQALPELFPIVLRWVDDRKLAMKCRLVCRYWEEQCRERAFQWINLRGSEKRVLDLVRLKYKPAWRHIPSLVEELDGLPEYTQSIQPWLHLLDPRWRPGIVTIVGPFPGRRTIRSIHFSLPRSPPSSFSRGIMSLKLDRVKFRHFEDTVDVISGLPDLVALKLEGVSWESLPTGLSRRRPPVHRNKLRYSDFYACTAGEEPESPLFIFTSFILFPHVYSGSSLFSVDVVIALEDVLRASADSKSGSVITVHTSKRVAGGFVDQISELFYFRTICEVPAGGLLTQ